MRGGDRQSGDLFSYVSIEDRVPQDHPLRLIREIANDVLGGLSSDFAVFYSSTGRPLIQPEYLPRALLLQEFYSDCSERQLMDQLNYNVFSAGLWDWAWTIRSVMHRYLPTTGTVF